MSKWVFLALSFLLFSNALAEPPGSARISGFKAFDEGSFGPQLEGAPFIDVAQGVCERKDQNGDGDKTDPEDVVLEGFYDTILGVTVSNDSNLPITIRRFTYSLRNGGNGRPFRSRALAPLEEAVISARSQKQLFFLFIKAVDGAKVFTGSGASIPPELGFKNVSAKLRGTDAAGRPLTLRGRTALSFGDFDRCAAGAASHLD